MIPQLTLSFDDIPPTMPPTAPPCSITAPFAGTREGYVAGWMLTYRDNPPVPTLNRVVGGTGFTYLPVVWGLAPSVSLHVRKGGELCLCHEGGGISIAQAIEQGLAWKIEGNQ